MVFLILCFLLLGCKKEKTRICKLYEGEVSYAIGTIDAIESAPLKVAYIYSYVVNGIQYTGEEKAYGIGQDDGSLIGEQFIVVYATGDPSNSDLNTDFPIETDQDFEDFKTEHLAAPPSPDFPDKCK